MATSVELLIAFRALQGLGAGGIFTLAMAIVGDLVSPRERGRYQGYIQAMFALASVAGPLIGGSIVDHLSWRWLFYVNLPVGAVAFTVIGATLRLPIQRQQRAIDYLGAGLMAAGLTCLLLMLVWVGSLYAWTSPEIVALLTATLVLGAAFVLREQRAPEPVLPLALLRNAVVAISGATLSATSSGRLISWTGRYKWFPVVGLALMAFTLMLFSQMGIATAPLTTGFVMALFGLGFGMVGEVLILAVQNAVDRRELGTATGTANLFRALGGSVGVSVYGSIFTGQLREWISRLVPGDVAGGLDPNSLQASPAMIRSLPDPVRDGLAQATAHALAPVFITAALMAAGGLLVVLFLEERPLQQADDGRSNERGHLGDAPPLETTSTRRSTHVHP
jgi:MFS family permease